MQAYISYKKQSGHQFVLKGDNKLDIKFLKKLNIEKDEWKDILDIRADIYEANGENCLCVTFGIMTAGRVVQEFTMTFTPRTARESEMRIPELPDSFIEEHGLETCMKVHHAMNYVKLAIINEFFPVMKINSSIH